MMDGGHWGHWGSMMGGGHWGHCSSLMGGGHWSSLMDGGHCSFSCLNDQWYSDFFITVL